MQPIGSHIENHQTLQKWPVKKLAGGGALVSGKVSGVEGKIDADGATVRVESIAALFTGGIAFENPLEITGTEPITATGKRYKLFDSRTDARESLFDSDDDQRCRGCDVLNSNHGLVLAERGLGGAFVQWGSGRGPVNVSRNATRSALSRAWENAASRAGRVSPTTGAG